MAVKLQLLPTGQTRKVHGSSCAIGRWNPTIDVQHATAYPVGANVPVAGGAVQHADSIIAASREAEVEL